MPINTYPLKQTKIISNELFAMIIFILTEVMFFTALISAYIVIESGNSYWEPPSNIKLPILFTIFNTIVLFTSGITLFRSTNKSSTPVIKSKHLLYSLSLGLFFVLFQGSEWLMLLKEGMSMESGLYSACFTLLIGSHALHALVGVIGLSYCYWLNLNEKLSSGMYSAARLFWYFVVAVWPIIFAVVYF
jgi:cytochrome c oxidase subunit III